MTGLDQRLPGMAVKKKYSITGKNVSSYQNGFELLIKDRPAGKRKATGWCSFLRPGPGPAVWQGI